MNAQQQIAQYTRDRGYWNGYTPFQLIVRQIQKLQEELAELAETPDYFDGKTTILDAGQVCRAYFKLSTPVFCGTVDMDAARKELADCQVVIFNLAEMLGMDVVSDALKKAQADVERGVTK